MVWALMFDNQSLSQNLRINIEHLSLQNEIKLGQKDLVDLTAFF